MAAKRDLQRLVQLLHDGIGSSDVPLVRDHLENMLQSVEYILSERFPDPTSRDVGDGATKSSPDMPPETPKKSVRFSDVVETITDENLGTGIGLMLPRFIEVCVYARMELMTLRKNLERRKKISKDWRKDFSRLERKKDPKTRKIIGDVRITHNMVGRLKSLFRLISGMRHPLIVDWNIDEKVRQVMEDPGDGATFFSELEGEFQRLVKKRRRRVPTVKITTVFKTMKFLLRTLRLHRSYINDAECVRVLRVNSVSNEILWSEGTITGNIQYYSHKVDEETGKEKTCGGSFEVTLDDGSKCRVRHGDTLQIRDAAASSTPTYMYGTVEYLFRSRKFPDIPETGDLRIRCRRVHRVRKCGEEHHVCQNPEDKTFEVNNGLRVKIQTYDLRKVTKFKGANGPGPILGKDVEVKICGAPSKLIKGHALKAGTVVDVFLKGEGSWRRGVKLSADANPINGHFAICGDDGSPIDVPSGSHVALPQVPSRPEYTVGTRALKLRTRTIALDRISAIKGRIVLDGYETAYWKSTRHLNEVAKKKFAEAQYQLKAIFEHIKRETERFKMPGSPSSGDREISHERLSMLIGHVETLVGHVNQKSTKSVTQVCRVCAEAILYCWAALYKVSDDLRERILTKKTEWRSRFLPFLYRQGIGIPRKTAGNLGFIFFRGTASHKLLANEKQYKESELSWNLSDTTRLVRTLTNELHRLYKTFVRVQAERDKGLVRNHTRVEVNIVDGDTLKKLKGTFVRTTLDCDVDETDYDAMNEDYDAMNEDDDDDDNDGECGTKHSTTSWKYEVLLDRDRDNVEILTIDSDRALTEGESSISEVCQATVVREETLKVEIKYEDTKKPRTAEVICTPGYLMRLQGVGAEASYFDRRGSCVLRVLRADGTQVVDERNGTHRRATILRETPNKVRIECDEDATATASTFAVKYSDDDDEEEVRIPNAWKIEMPVRQVLTVVDAVEITKKRTRGNDSDPTDSRGHAKNPFKDT